MRPVHHLLAAALVLGARVAWGVDPSLDDPAAGEYLGRPIAQTMHFLGAPWLVRESRDREEEPERLVDALGLRPGQAVCDLGCGNGFYTLRLAERVGHTGRVWAVDIQPEMLADLKDRLAVRRLENVVPHLGAEDDPRLPVGEFDLVLLVDVYHEFSRPAEMLAAIRGSLAPTGRVALVEFRAEDPTVPIKPLHKMTQQQCLKEFEANGLKLVGQYDGLPWQHVLFFARDDSPLIGVPIREWSDPKGGQMPRWSSPSEDPEAAVTPGNGQ